MPIVATRNGDIISAPQLPQEQRDKLWEIIVRNWARNHPEAFNEAAIPQTEEAKTE